MALPYTITFTNVVFSDDADTGFLIGNTGTLDAAHSSTGTALPVVTSASRNFTGPAFELSVNSGSNDITDELRDALVSLRNNDGTITAFSMVLANQADTTNPYNNPITEEEVAAAIAFGQDSPRTFQLHFEEAGSETFTFPITALGANTNNFTSVGDGDADDDQRVLPQLAADPNNLEAIDRIRFRNNQVRIEFAGTTGRFSQEVEDNYLLEFSGPGDVHLATLHDIGSYWNAANNEYRINSNNAFLDSSLSALNLAIRALGLNAEVSLFAREPFVDEAGGTGASEAGAATGGLRQIDTKKAGGTGASEVGAASGDWDGIKPATKPAVGSGASEAGAGSGGAVARPSFIGIASGASAAGAASGLANKIAVGPPKPMVGTGASAGEAAAGSDLTQIDTQKAVGTGASESTSAAQGGLKALDTKLAGGTGVSAPLGAGTLLSAEYLDPILDPPTALTLLDAGRDFIAFSWTPPTQDFGIPITYEIRVNNQAWQATGAQTFYLLSGLLIDTAYLIEVRAVNNEIAGEPSESAQFRTIIPPVPTAPRYVLAEPSGATYVDLSWREPEDTGSVELLRYEVSVVEEDGTVLPFERTEDATPSWRVRGLSTGHRYGFRIRAANRTGVGAVSRVIYGRPGLIVPAPQIPSNAQRVPLLDADRQSMILRIADEDVRLSVWWQPSDPDDGEGAGGWWASLEVPANTPAVQSRRLALNSGILDRVKDVLPGNFVLRGHSTNGLEPARDAWRRQTHAIYWEPDA